MKFQLILLFVLLRFYTYSQEFIYREFGINEGLPSSQVYDMYQSDSGMLWFATDRGLANYNGYEIKKFGVQDGILDNVVLDFHPQEDGTVYCSTLNHQLFSFEEKFNGFKPYEFNPILSSTLSTSQFITNLFIDDTGSFHFGCENFDGKLKISNSGELSFSKEKAENEDGSRFIVYQQKGDRIFNYRSNTEKKQSIFTNYPTDTDVLFLDKSEMLIFKDYKSVRIYTKNGDFLREIENNLNPLIIREIDETYFFVGYLFGGGQILDINGNVLESFLMDKSITDFLIDHEGGYWFSTLYSGVYYIKEPKVRVLQTDNINTPINSLSKNKNNEILVGFDNGDINKISLVKTSKTIYHPPRYCEAFVEFNASNEKSIIYTGDQFYTNESFVSSEENKLHALKISEPTKEGTIISLINAIAILDVNYEIVKKIQLPFRVHDACFYEDKIYLCSPDGVYSYQNDTIADLKISNPLFQYRADDVDYNAGRNEVYFATLGQGIIVYNKGKNSIYTITEKDGLLGNIVNEIHIESENEIWVCTNSGLNKITFDSNDSMNIEGLKTSNGLLNDGINDVEIVKNEVWIASKKGLIHTEKNIFDPHPLPVFDVNIKEVKLNDNITNVEYLKDLSHTENRIEINFEAISLKNEDNLIYKYKLEGLDNKWYYTTQRKVIFPALPFSNYTFKVGALTSLKDEAKSFLEVPISIRPPIWKTNWFFALLFLMTNAVIYLFFKVKVLSYNKDITRELIRLIIKKIKRKDKYFIFREAGKEKRIKSNTILYVKSAGNYIEIITEAKIFTVRCKIGDFQELTPDPMEYIRIHRSYIVRIDKVDTKSNQELTINEKKLPVSQTFKPEIEKLFF